MQPYKQDEFFLQRELTEEKRVELINRLASEVVERNLTAPAIFLLEMGRPFTFIGSQVMVFLEPIIQSIFNIKIYNHIRLMLEDRKNLDELLLRIEDYDEKFRSEQKERKKADKKAGALRMKEKREAKKRTFGQ
jgi:hypothetical protein